MPRAVRSALCALTVACLGFAQVYEQTYPSEQIPGFRALSGVIRDQNGHPVKGAVVQIKNTLSLQVRSYITQEDGRYQFSLLSDIVDYRVYAKYKGQSSSSKTLSMFSSAKEAVINLTVPVE